MKTTMYKKLIALFEAMAEIFPNDLISVYNEFVDLEAATAYDMRTYIYHMYEFDKVFANHTPLEIADCLSRNEDFYSQQSYFNFDNNGNLYSFDWLTHENCNINFAELAEYICETYNSLGCDIIQHVIDQYYGKGGC